MSSFLIICFLTNCGVGKSVTSEDVLDYGNGERDPIYDHNASVDLGDEEHEIVDTIDWKDTDPLVHNPEDTAIVGNTPIEKEIEDETEEELIEELNNQLQTKDGYKVVIMLPFFTNKFNPPYGNISKDSKMALEFYEGAKMAFDRLKNEGINLDITILDTKGETGTVQYLLQRTELLEADLIIGPVTKGNSRLVAEFAQKNRKTMISPLNRRNDITRQNPFYIQVNPPLQLHFTKLLQYTYQNYGNNSNTLIIAPAGKTGDKRVQYWQRANFIANQSTSVPPIKSISFDPKSAGNVELDLRNYLTKGSQNIVIIPSSSQSFVNFMMRELSVLRHDYPMVVLGMHYWEHFEKVDYSYYENLKVHISSEFFVNKNDSEYRNFKRGYFDNYGASPSEYVVKGFDTALYFSRMLNKYGVFPQNHLADDESRYMHTKFEIAPKFSSTNLSSESGGSIKCYENKYINILKFEDYQFRRVN